jgi:hypothetical protein
VAGPALDPPANGATADKASILPRWTTGLQPIDFLMWNLDLGLRLIHLIVLVIGIWPAAKTKTLKTI